MYLFRLFKGSIFSLLISVFVILSVNALAQSPARTIEERRPEYDEIINKMDIEDAFVIFNEERGRLRIEDNKLFLVDELGTEHVLEIRFGIQTLIFLDDEGKDNIIIPLLRTKKPEEGEKDELLFLNRAGFLVIRRFKFRESSFIFVDEFGREFGVPMYLRRDGLVFMDPNGVEILVPLKINGNSLVFFTELGSPFHVYVK